MIRRIFQKNRKLKKDKKNPYANERIELQRIRQDIENINLRIGHLYQMRERLRKARIETPADREN